MVRMVGWRVAAVLAVAAAFVAVSGTGAGAYTGTGGGYSVADSDEATGGPIFAWDDPTSATPVALTATATWPAADEGYGTVAIPWSFSYMGSPFTSVLANANGYLQFGGPAIPDYGGGAIPSTATPNGVAAAFWDDLDGSVAPAGSIRSQVLGVAPSRRLVISWVGWRRYGAPSADNLTFQATLFEQGSGVRFQYQTMTGTGAPGTYATIGIENAAGSAGVLYLNNGTPAGNAVGPSLSVGHVPTGTTPPWPTTGAPPPPPPPPPGGGTPANNDDDDDGRLREIRREMCNSAASAHAGLAGLVVTLAALALVVRRK